MVPIKGLRLPAKKYHFLCMVHTFLSFLYIFASIKMAIIIRYLISTKPFKEVRIRWAKAKANFSLTLSLLNITSKPSGLWQSCHLIDQLK